MNTLSKLAKNKKALLVLAAAAFAVIAFAKPVEYADLTDVLIAADEKGKVPFLVLLDGIEDVHNMGAIIRTAECAGVDAVLLPKRRTALINQIRGFLLDRGIVVGRQPTRLAAAGGIFVPAG